MNVLIGQRATEHIYWFIYKGTDGVTRLQASMVEPSSYDSPNTIDGTVEQYVGSTRSRVLYVPDFSTGQEAGAYRYIGRPLNITTKGWLRLA